MERVLAALLIVAAAAFAASPLITPPFEGFRPDQFPVPQNRPPVQPAGYAFAIWSVIYLWLIVGAGFGFFRRASEDDWSAHRLPLLLSLIAGVFWLPVAATNVIGATVLIWVMLATALWALFKTGDMDRWLQQAPVAIYAGWLTAASNVAIGLCLAGYGYLGETVAALIGLTCALVIAVIVQFRLHRAPEYGLTVIWALVAVIVANTQPANAAVIGLASLGILAILSLRTTDTE